MKPKRSVQNIIYFLAALIVTTLSTTAPSADEEIKLYYRQSVYVPIYSHIYSGLKGRPFDLAATLSIRNTDPNNPITLVSVKYYDSDGNLVKEYLDGAIQLRALGSTRYIITEADTAGGSGANFIVKWESQAKVNPPIIEGVMIGTKSGQGISFVSRGQVIQE